MPYLFKDVTRLALKQTVQKDIDGKFILVFGRPVYRQNLLALRPEALSRLHGLRNLSMGRTL